MSCKRSLAILCEVEDPEGHPCVLFFFFGNFFPASIFGLLQVLLTRTQVDKDWQSGVISLNNDCKYPK